MKYRTKTRAVEAITFDELVEYGRSVTPQNHLVNGMPWAFEYKGRNVTHENDTCYLILGVGTDLRMTPGDMLIAGEHDELWTCMHDTFEASYEPAEAGAQQEQPMTFEEWWGGDRDRTLAYDLMKVLTEAAKQAWHAGHVTSIEEMLEKWNRTGVDIDAALHGRVNKESPIANRLKMIAAIAQPQWRPMESAPKDGTPFLAHWNAEELPVVASFRDGYFRGLDGDSDSMTLLGWIPLPPAPEKTTTGEQEDRDVT